MSLFRIYKSLTLYKDKIYLLNNTFKQELLAYTVMVTAKCNRCLGTGEGSTFSEASQNIDHAIGLSRGKKCGRKYNQVIEVGASSKPKTKKPSKASTPKASTPKPDPKKSATPISEDTKE